RSAAGSKREPRLRSTRNSGGLELGPDDRLDLRELDSELTGDHLAALPGPEGVHDVLYPDLGTLEDGLTEAEPGIDDHMCTLVPWELQSIRIVVAATPADKLQIFLEHLRNRQLTVACTFPSRRAFEGRSHVDKNRNAVRRDPAAGQRVLGAQIG